MRSRSDQLTSNRSNLAVPLLTFPCHTPVPTLRIIIVLIVCTGLHEFDRTWSQELLKALKCDLVGFSLYSETAKAFAPVSELQTSLSARKEQLARQRVTLCRTDDRTIGRSPIPQRPCELLGCAGDTTDNAGGRNKLVPTARARLTNMVGLFKALGEGGHRPPSRPLPNPLLGAIAEMEVTLAMDSAQHYDDR